MSVYNYWRL